MRLHLGNLSLIPCTVENATIDAASCKVALFMKLYYLNHASLHEAESIITFSTVPWQPVSNNIGVIFERYAIYSRCI